MRRERSWISRFYLSGTATLALALSLTGCTSIRDIGQVGNTTLRVYSIKDTDAFSANRMLIVVDGEGRAVASTGGTVSGPAPIAAGLAGSVIMGGAIAYAGAQIRGGLENASLSTKISGTGTVHCNGCPSTVTVNGSAP